MLTPEMTMCAAKLRVLNEYDFMKLVCILLVVIGHACNMYSPNGAVVVDHSPTLIAIRDFIYKVFCHMPVFCAISGTLYYGQVSKGKYADYFGFLLKKAKRLLVPYAFFSLFWVFPVMWLIKDIDNPVTYFLESYVLTHDTRHLWFLLMLFQNFAVFHLLEPIVRKHKNLWLLVFLLVHLFHKSYYDLINPSYLLWFYMGYYQQANRDFIEKIGNGWIAAFITVPVILYYSELQGSRINLVYPLCYFIALLKIGQLFKKNFINSRFAREMANHGMGIYLFHPMIIYLLSYGLCQVSLPVCVSFLLILFVSFFISLLLSKCIKSCGLGFAMGE